MNVVELIRKKRDGAVLTPEEISWLVSAYVRGDVPDYQMAAFLMAVFFRGMNPGEMVELTLAMAASGEQLDLSGIPGVKIDKHSTGGVGDKTTLVVGPLVAAAGAPFVKLSGRGLGHSGGTLDKLESIPGFRVALEPGELVEQVKRIGIALAGQTGQLVPADAMMYALRDVTATVESIPLIGSSIMSKKLAGGADGIILDVKVGRGAFMKTREEAARLARAMVQIGLGAGRPTVAFLTAMDQPLGRAVGNSLEVREAIETLKGGGPADLRALVLALGARHLVMAGLSGSEALARETLESLLDGGFALEKFRLMVEAQGGDQAVVEDPDRLPRAPVTLEVRARRHGFVNAVDALAVGRAARDLGAGRRTRSDIVDPAAGIVLFKKRGERVAKGETLAQVHARNVEAAGSAVRALEGAFRIEPGTVNPGSLILEVVEEV